MMFPTFLTNHSSPSYLHALELVSGEDSISFSFRMDIGKVKVFAYLVSILQEGIKVSADQIERQK